MADAQELVTVFRSADHAAQDQAERVGQMLAEKGIEAEVLSPSAPGVLVGTFEVRVPASQAAAAEAVLAEEMEPRVETVDPSSDLDLVIAFQSDRHDAESEALAVLGLLEASGIPAVLDRSTPYPVLPWIVRVPKSKLAEATAILEAARSASAAEAAGDASPDDGSLPG